jgi:hypothetical protein
LQLLHVYSSFVLYTHDSFLFAGLCLLNMESAESQQATPAKTLPAEKALQYAKVLVRAYQQSKYNPLFVRHNPAREPVDDYITEFETRCQLFTRFLKCVVSSNFFNPELAIKSLDSIVFAIVMVAPIGVLQKALSDQRHRDAWVISFFGMTTHNSANLIVKRCRPGFSVTGSLDFQEPNIAPLSFAIMRADEYAVVEVLPSASTPRPCAFSLILITLILSAKSEIIILVFLPARAIQWRPIYSPPYAARRITLNCYRYFRFFRAKIAECDSFLWGVPTRASVETSPTCFA